MNSIFVPKKNLRDAHNLYAWNSYARTTPANTKYIKVCNTTGCNGWMDQAGVNWRGGGVVWTLIELEKKPAPDAGDVSKQLN